MNKLITITITLFIGLTANQAISATHPATFTYEVQTGDVGTIKSTAVDKKSAFVAAGNECFDRRVALYEAKRGTASEDRLLSIIDSCANLAY